MLQQARDFAQRGVDAAGRDLLAVSDNHEGARLYAEIMTHLRRQSEAFERLQRATADAASFGAQVEVAVKQVQKNGIVSITDQQWRDRAVSARRDTARSGMQSAMQAMGRAVHDYFTPEERTQFAGWLDNTAGQSSATDVADVYLPAADSAELPDLQARWLNQLMLLNYSGNAAMFKSRLVELQTKGMRFQNLGLALESYAYKLGPQTGRDAVLTEAALVNFPAEFK
jgi:hypothetical protein